AASTLQEETAALAGRIRATIPGCPLAFYRVIVCDRAMGDADAIPSVVRCRLTTAGEMHALQGPHGGHSLCTGAGQESHTTERSNWEVRSPRRSHYIVDPENWSTG